MHNRRVVITGLGIVGQQPVLGMHDFETGRTTAHLAETAETHTVREAVLQRVEVGLEVA